MDSKTTTDNSDRGQVWTKKRREALGQDAGTPVDEQQVGKLTLILMLDVKGETVVAGHIDQLISIRTLEQAKKAVAKMGYDVVAAETCFVVVTQKTEKGDDHE